MPKNNLFKLDTKKINELKNQFGKFQTQLSGYESKVKDIVKTFESRQEKVRADIEKIGKSRLKKITTDLKKTRSTVEKRVTSLVGETRKELQTKVNDLVIYLTGLAGKDVLKKKKKSTGKSKKSTGARKTKAKRVLDSRQNMRNSDRASESLSPA